MTGRPVARRCIKLLADLRRAGALGYTPALWAWGQGLRAGRGGWAPAQPSSPMSPLPSPQRGSLPCSPSTLCSPRLRVVFLKHSPQYLLGWLCHLRSLLRSHFAGPSRPGSHLPVPCRSSNWVIRQGPGLGPRVRVPVSPAPRTAPGHLEAAGPLSLSPSGAPLGAGRGRGGGAPSRLCLFSLPVSSALGPWRHRRRGCRWRHCHPESQPPGGPTCLTRQSS